MFRSQSHEMRNAPQSGFDTAKPSEFFTSSQCLWRRFATVTPLLKPSTAPRVRWNMFALGSVFVLRIVAEPGKSLVHMGALA